MLQWFGVAGMTLDILGFLVLAREWYRIRNLSRQLIGLEQTRMGIWSGTGPAYVAKEPQSGDFILPGSKAEFDHKTLLYSLQHADMLKRRLLFCSGIALVILGYILQMIGSWPK